MTAPLAAGGACPRGSGEIVVCGVRYAIDWPVINFLDDPRIAAREADAVPTNPCKGLEGVTRRFGVRRALGASRDLRALQAVVRQFVLHHDGCWSAHDCFQVLQVERGLSVHFLIDNDGTILQTLDLLHLAWHAQGANGNSIGVELCNRGIIGGSDDYRRRGQARSDALSLVHGHRQLMWDFTPCQYQAMVALGRALQALLPNLPAAFPCDGSGGLVLRPLQGAADFAGYLGHYHVSPNKWDPGCFDFRALIERLKPRTFWFVRPRAAASATLAEDPQQARREAQALFDDNERHPLGGFYPLAPFGEHRLWHGGIHLPLPVGTPIHSPLPGQLVAARQTPRALRGAPFGSSTLFVLTRHRVMLARPITFFLLFFHLAPADPTKAEPRWFSGAARAALWERALAGEVLYPNVAVAAGEVLGHAGLAGPDTSRRGGQVHVEVLAPAEITARIAPGAFTPIDAGSSGHFCDRPEILGLIDADHDGVLDREELLRFFRSHPDRVALRKLAVRSLSEWGHDPQYLVSLERSRDFRALSQADREELYRTQIHPTLFLGAELARRTGLPADGVVWHYHPVEFLLWLDGELRRHRPVRTVDPAARRPGAQSANPHEGDDFLTEDDRREVGHHAWTLEELAAGYETDLG